MLIHYKNLKIRNAEEDDAKLLSKWWNDGRVMAHAGFPDGLKTSPQKISQELATDSNSTVRRLIIEIDDKPVGEMSYRNKGDGIAEIGIKICEFHQQGKGYGTLLLKMLITGLFSEGYEKIILDTNLNNTRAQHVYEKLGFIKKRIKWNSFKDQRGRMQSSVDYELTPSIFVPLDS